VKESERKANLIFLQQTIFNENQIVPIQGNKCKTKEM